MQSTILALDDLSKVIILLFKFLYYRDISTLGLGYILYLTNTLTKVSETTTSYIYKT